MTTPLTPAPIPNPDYITAPFQCFYIHSFTYPSWAKSRRKRLRFLRLEARSHRQSIERQLNAVKEYAQSYNESNTRPT